MARMQHGSARAALIYQHAITQRDAMIADALSLSIDLNAIGHATATTPLTDPGAREPRSGIGLLTWAYRKSGRRESNSRNQFGRLRLYH
jgi:hypothetical protein